jgi:hypothetical protein
MTNPKEEAAAQGNGQAANNTDAAATNIPAAPGVQATYRGSSYRSRVTINGSTVIVEGRDEKVISALVRAGLWPHIVPRIRDGVAFLVEFPGRRDSFVAFVGNRQDGGFLRFTFHPKDFSAIWRLAARVHLGRELAPDEVPQ